MFLKLTKSHIELIDTLPENLISLERLELAHNKLFEIEKLHFIAQNLKEINLSRNYLKRIVWIPLNVKKIQILNNSIENLFGTSKEVLSLIIQSIKNKIESHNFSKQGKLLINKYIEHPNDENLSQLHKFFNKSNMASKEITSADFTDS